MMESAKGLLKSNKSVSVILAGYNEEDNIERSVGLIYETLESAFQEFEVILVNDASKDNTGAVMHEFAALKDNVVVLDNFVNLNFGTSVLRGMVAARYDYITFNACDLPLSPQDLIRLIEEMPEDCDMLVMERMDYETTRWRGITSGINKALLHLLFPRLTAGTPVLNYVQIYRKRIIKSIIPLARSPIFVWPELVFRAKLLSGAKWRNEKVKCNVKNVRKGAFGHPHDIIWGMYDMLRFRIRLWGKTI